MMRKLSIYIFFSLFVVQINGQDAYDWVGGSYRAKMKLSSNSKPDSDMYTGTFQFRLYRKGAKLTYTQSSFYAETDWDGKTGNVAFSAVDGKNSTEVNLTFLADGRIKVFARIKKPESRYKEFHDYQGSAVTDARPGDIVSEKPAKKRETPSDETPGLMVVEIVDDVEIRNLGSAWEEAKIKSKLVAGDEVSTGASSSITLQYPDGTTVIIHEMSQIRVSFLIKEKNGIRAQISLKQGKITARINPKWTSFTDFTIKAPIATASVRGTEFSVSHMEAPSRMSIIKVTKGRVLVTPDNKKLQPIMLLAGSEARVTDDDITTKGAILPPDTPFEQITRDGETNKESDVTTAHLALNKNIFSEKEEIIVTFSGMSGAPNDWISLTAKSKPVTSYDKYLYTKGKKSGSLTFQGLPSGEYEARAYFKDSYKLEAKVGFSVSDGAITTSGSNVHLALNKNVFSENEEITVTFSGMSGATSDWIALTAKNKPITTYNKYFYTAGKKSGSLTFPGLKAGEYEARAYFKDSYKLEARVSFKVVK